MALRMLCARTAPAPARARTPHARAHRPPPMHAPCAHSEGARAFTEGARVANGVRTVRARGAHCVLVVVRARARTVQCVCVFAQEARTVSGRMWGGGGCVHGERVRAQCAGVRTV